MQATLLILVNTRHQDVKMTALQNFLYPQSSYQGSVQPENLVFNANLQEFAQRVTYICCLQTGGKLSPNEAFEKIRSLWQQLKQSHYQLGIDKQSINFDSSNLDQ